MYSFGPWQEGSDDAKDMLWLLQRDDVWEPQARDGDEKEKAALSTFPGTWLAVFRDQMSPVGYILYVPRNPHCSVMEQHTGFIESARGKDAIDAMQSATAAVFLQTPCSRIVSYCPDWHPGTKGIARQMGSVPLYYVPKFAKRAGIEYGATLYGLTVLEWAFRNHMNYAHIGHRWHEEVFAKLEPHHEDDDVHDGFLGLAVEMGVRNPHKAVAVYNIWAELAGYAPASVQWADGQGNALIDISNAYVLNSGNRAIAAFAKNAQDHTSHKRDDSPS